MQENEYMQRIVATLKHGWFDGESAKRMVIAFVAFAVIIFTGMVAFVTIIAVGIVNDPKNIIADLFAILGIVAVLSTLFVVFLVLIIKNEKHRKEIKLWLSDAVELTAYSKKIGERSSYASPRIYKVQVEFKYMDKRYSYESRGKPLGGFGVPDGYHGVFKDYLNREVTILYSPKYEEVMILKSRV